MNSSVKKCLCVGAGFGVGAVLMAVILLASISWYKNRPMQWNTKAVVASFQGLQDVPTDADLAKQYGGTLQLPPGATLVQDPASPRRRRTTPASDSQFGGIPVADGTMEWGRTEGRGEARLVYSFKNTTDHDYTISDSESNRLMIRTSEGLQSQTVYTIQLPVFVPAGQTTKVTIGTPREFKANERLRFAFFDETHKYCIDLPVTSDKVLKSGF
jgi:hypothetical protein